jgi:DNA-directed RNA polymerase specialized sigma24 family protein
VVAVRLVAEPLDLLNAALSGERTAMRALVDRLAPVIWSRVTRMAQRGRRTPDQVRQLGEDLTQDVFAALFQDGGRALRGWVPARGLSLEAYVGLLAEHQAASILRSGRRSAWREDATSDETLVETAGATAAADGPLLARDVLVRVLERVRQELSPRGLQIFELLVVEERSVADVCAIMSMTPDAVYAWRSRIGKLTATIAAELEGMSEPETVTRSRMREAR